MAHNSMPLELWDAILNAHWQSQLQPLYAFSVHGYRITMSKLA